MATAAPAMPPTRACDELVGSPAYQVITSHAIAPISPAKITRLSKISGFTTSFAIVAATVVPKTTNADEVEERRPRDGLPGREHAGGHDGGDRVRRVVEAVEEVERERDRDDQDDGQTHRELRVLEHRRLDDVGDVLEAVERLLQVLDDLLPLEDVHGLDARPRTGPRSLAGRAGRPRSRAG